MFRGLLRRYLCLNKLTDKSYLFVFAGDIFGIDEITLYEGKHNDKVYSVAGEILDGVSITISPLFDIREFIT